MFFLIISAVRAICSSNENFKNLQKSVFGNNICWECIAVGNQFQEGDVHDGGDQEHDDHNDDYGDHEIQFKISGTRFDSELL